MNLFSQMLLKHILPFIKEQGFQDDKIFLNWNSIVSNDFAKFCYPLKLIIHNLEALNPEFTLYIVADNPVAFMILFSEKKILKNIKIFCNHNITKIKCLPKF